MYSLTFGHFLASAAASPDVIRRQLLPPNPSETERVISLVPHHAGTSPVALVGGAADVAGSVSTGPLVAGVPVPQAATMRATAAMPTPRRCHCQRAVRVSSLDL